MPNAKSLVLVFALLLMSNVLLGYQLYVDAAANPQTADGSSAHPYITIQDAIDHAFDDSNPANQSSPSVLINVGGGVCEYLENLIVNFCDNDGSPHIVQNLSIVSNSDNNYESSVMSSLTSRMG